jgi:hypothetical protein
VCDRRGVPDALLCELPRIFSPIIVKDPNESLVVRAEAPVPVFKSAILFLLHLLVGKQDGVERRPPGNRWQVAADARAVPPLARAAHSEGRGSDLANGGS